ncbi:MAG: hypothetical protein ACI4XL_01875 [Bacillus sp. (in: firmicutes)]
MYDEWSYYRGPAPIEYERGPFFFGAPLLGGLIGGLAGGALGTALFAPRPPVYPPPYYSYGAAPVYPYGGGYYY